VAVWEALWLRWVGVHLVPIRDAPIYAIATRPWRLRVRPSIIRVRVSSLRRVRLLHEECKRASSMRSASSPSPSK